MKLKLLIILLLIVLLPFGLIAWLGYRLARDEREMTGKRIEALLTQRLGDVQKRIAEILTGREAALLAHAGDLVLDAETLREFPRDNSWTNQMFALDPKGELIYPAPREANEVELEFLRRTQKIWENKELLYQTQTESDVQTQQTIPQKMAPGSPRAGSSGWYVWYWGKGMNLLCWMVNQEGNTVGAEIETSRLLADIIAALPDTPAGGSARSGEKSRIALVDMHGETLYQWGSYAPPAKAKPAAALQLAYPLSSWKLEYFGPPEALAASAGPGEYFGVAAGSAALGIALLIMVVYFYREHTRQMREAAQRVNFVNQVSHELKTPLTNIRMYAELLEREIEAEAEKPARYLNVIVSESQRLSRLISNILTFSRKERNKLQLHKTRGILDTTIKEVIQDFEPLMTAKGVKIEFYAAATKAVLFDADVVEQILGNLFSNVEKYATDGGWMGITSRQDGERATIVVVDHGPGISSEQREKIFQPFYRISNKLTDGTAGTGIGLALARDLARMHGGDLILRSGEGRIGAAFELTLQTPLPD